MNITSMTDQMTQNCLLCISRKIRFAELEELGNVDHVAVDGDHLRQRHVLEAGTKKNPQV